MTQRHNRKETAKPEKDRVETVVALRPMRLNALLKTTGIVCQTIPVVAVVLMTMGAWDVALDSAGGGDALDGGLRTLAVVAGLVGVLCWAIADSVSQVEE